MPLSNYGVVLGTVQSFTRDPQHDFGHWYHGHLGIEAAGTHYEAALDVDAPASVGVSYRLVTDLHVGDIAQVAALPDGFHPLAHTPGSGALDYVRSPLLANRLWWTLKKATATTYRLAKPPAVGAPVYGPDLADDLAYGLSTLEQALEHALPERVSRQRHRIPWPAHWRWRVFPWHPSDGDNALDALAPHVAQASRAYLFGQAFTTGLGVHDVHLNQGDPVGSQWYADNGTWQDGAVMLEKPDGSVVVWQLKFNTQSLDTDDNGHPH
jgi:hypothetical protein